MEKDKRVVLHHIAQMRAVSGVRITRLHRMRLAGPHTPTPSLLHRYPHVYWQVSQKWEPSWPLGWY